MSQAKTEQMILGYAKIFMGQYLTKLHGYQSYQEGAIHLLANYMVKLITLLASNVKKIVDMQGRSMPNALHLLVAVDLKRMVDLEDVLRHIFKMRQVRQEEFDVLRKYGGMVFKNDVSSVNSYQRQTRYRNIQYVPAVYTYNIQQKALPYRHPLHQSIEQPLVFTYKHTKKIVSLKQPKIEQLQSYHRQEIKRANSILLSKQQEDKQHRKRNETNKNRKVQTVVVKRSASETHLPSKIEMTRCKSTKDHTHVLPAEEEDHKVSGNDEIKTDYLKLLRPKETVKITQKDQKSADKFTLKKAVATIYLSSTIQQPKTISLQPNIKNHSPSSLLARRLSIQSPQKREYGSGLNTNCQPQTSLSKKNKFDLISFL